MANETITGCYNASNGVVTFNQPSAGAGDCPCWTASTPCKYNGCYAIHGIHADQIAVTVDSDTCNDTYYACYDKETGYFELTLPDTCCSSGQPPTLTMGIGDAIWCADWDSPSQLADKAAWETIRATYVQFELPRHLTISCLYETQFKLDTGIMGLFVFQNIQIGLSYVSPYAVYIPPGCDVENFGVESNASLCIDPLFTRFSWWASWTAIPLWETGEDYSSGNIVNDGAALWLCITDHISSAATEPLVGVDWTNVWEWRYAS